MSEIEPHDECLEHREETISYDKVAIQSGREYDNLSVDEFGFLIRVHFVAESLTAFSLGFETFGQRRDCLQLRRLFQQLLQECRHGGRILWLGR
jgi:hypothetical protein